MIDIAPEGQIQFPALSITRDTCVVLYDNEEELTTVIGRKKSTGHPIPGCIGMKIIDQEGNLFEVREATKGRGFFPILTVFFRFGQNWVLGVFGVCEAEQRVGNENSGRWTSADAKTTVEECSVLDIADWLRSGLLEPGVCRSGIWGWRAAGTGKLMRSIGYRVDIRVDPHAWLEYHLPRTGEYVDYRLDGGMPPRGTGITDI